MSADPTLVHIVQAVLFTLADASGTVRGVGLIIAMTVFLLALRVAWAGIRGDEDWR